MANRYSIATGLASAASTWDGGVTVPVTGDRVLISHPGTATNTFSTNTAGYTIGATAITLTGSVAAGSYVIGESVQFPGDPNYYVISGWNSSTKVLTISALIIAIPASATVVTNCGHVVTLNGTFEWGDDSTSTIVINTVSTTASIWVAGTLKASRTVSSQLTCNGTIRTANVIGGGIDYGRTTLGTGVNDPIPPGITAKMILNKSAVMAICKYGLYVDNGAAFYCAGETINPNATLVSNAAATQAVMTVDNVTGWAAGDRVILASTNPANYGEVEEKTISTIVANGGNWDVTFTTNLSYLHKAQGIAMVFSSNVVFTSYNAAYPGTNQHWWTLTQPVNTREYCYTLFENGGSINVGGVSAASLYLAASSSPGVYTMAAPRIVGDMFYSKGNAISECLYLGQYRPGYLVEDCAAVGGTTGANLSLFNVGIRATLNRCFATYGQYGYRGPIATGILNDCKFIGVSAVGGWSGTYCEYNNCHIDAFGGIASHICVGTVIFNTCKLGSVFGFAPSSAQLAPSGKNSQIQLNAINCQMPVTITPALTVQYARLQDCTPDTYYKITNKNGDVTAQELYRPDGKFVRDNALFYRSKSAIACTPWNSFVSGAVSYPVEFLAANGVAQTIVGYLRKNTAYGASTLPSVTVSGLGIAPVTYTMSGAADTWEQFTLNVTQTSGADGNLTLTFSGQSTGAGAQCWLDGIPSAPFVTACRHYGYVFAPTSVVRAVDGVAQLSEAAANALTGLSVDFGTQTLTISGTRSLREIYDWCHAQLCVTANLSQPEFFTSVDGVNFNCAFNVVLSGTITGTGAISMPAKTLTYAGGTSSANITHGAGVFTGISVTGYTVGARLQVYDMTAASELYNDIPGAALSLNLNWTVNHTIRLRMARTVGLDADLLIQTVGTFSAIGASFLLAPSPDTVYEANAIDGATVTEFTADYPNVQIDVNDLDGATTPQRIYAWYMAGQMTADGLRNYHGALTADDAMNYRINVAVADMKVQNTVATPVAISGARLYRSDGTSYFVAGAGPIQADPGKAYIADSTGLAAAIAALPTADQLATAVVNKEIP